MKAKTPKLPADLAEALAALKAAQSSIDDLQAKRPLGATFDEIFTSELERRFDEMQQALERVGAVLVKYRQARTDQ
jgi:hypothetical protein